MGRFINADVFAATGQGFVGNNMFAYCNNNPVNQVDPSGFVPFLVPIIVPIIVASVNNLINAIYYESSDGHSDVTSESYRDEYVSRWDRLDYAKQETGEDYYNP